MTNLLVLMSNILDCLPKAADALTNYRQKGFEIAVLEHQGCMSAEGMLSRCIQTMAIAPVDHFLICSDEMGGHAYFLSASEGGFPTLRKLKSKQLSAWATPPDEGHWEEVDIQSFAKPNAGLVDMLIHTLQPEHALLICNDALDEATGNDTSFITGSSQIYLQTTDKWLSQGNGASQQAGQAQRPQNTPGVSLPTNTRRFELINRAQNASKFWQIALRPDGLGFTTGYGRIGTKGQSTLKVFTTPFACRQAYDQLIAQKLRKGYVEG